MALSGLSLFERAARGEAVERVPVWAMRQAGRWDPEFRRLRGSREFFEFSADPDAAAAASLCPLRFGVDAIILFYDITTLAISMGQRFELVPGRGPCPERPIRTRADVARLSAHPDGPAVDAVAKTLELVRQRLPAGVVPLVFAGAPFTLATYQIGTGKNLASTLEFIQDAPEVWSALLEKTAEATVRFLRVLLDAGAAAYQLFDSWAGALAREDYSRYAQPYHARIFSETGGLSILFVKDGRYVDLMCRSGAKIVSLGRLHDLGKIHQQHPDMVFQGNVDHELLVSRTPQVVAAAARACLNAGGGRRHILNLDHGMDPAARPENFAAFVDAARSFRPSAGR